MNDAPPISSTEHSPGHSPEPATELLEWWRARGHPFFDRYGGVLAAIVLAATFVAMLSWTWLRWADPIANCGREFYVPQQLARGQVLYRDIAHINGPFSQYFNALVFWICGVSVRSLVVVNLAWLILLTATIWRLWRAMADRFAATIACLVLLLLCSFVQLTRTGGFNFVTPFAHEMTHGVILAMAAIGCLGAYLRSVYVRRPEGRWMVAAGLALGLVFLTRAELFLAAAPSVTIGACAAMYARRVPAKLIRVHLVALIGSTLLPPLVALLLLHRALPWSEALGGTVGSWRWSFDERIVGMSFFQNLRGTDWPARNLGRMLFCAGGYLLLLGGATVAAMLVRRPGEPHVIAAATSGGLVVAAFVVVYDTFYWQYALMGLNLVMVALALTYGAMLLQRRRDQIDAALILRLTLVWFALLLLARMGLRVVLFEYGFVIAMPATLVAIAAAVSWLPRLIERHGGAGWVVRMAALAALGMLCFRHLDVFGRNFNDKPVVIGAGADALRFDRARGGTLRDMLEQVDRRLGPNDTLAVIPEAAFVNYYSRRANPTGYVNPMPPEMIMFGPDRVLDRFRTAPPDWIVITHSDAAAYGFQSFAADYGRDVWVWAAANYHEVATVGKNDVFFMRLFERNDRVRGKSPAAPSARREP
jgi:hypothetical protein